MLELTTIRYTCQTQLGSLGHFTFNFGYGKVISIFSQNSSKFCCHLFSSPFIFSELDIMMRNVDYLLVLYHDRKKRSQKGCMTSQPQNFQLWNFFQPNAGISNPDFFQPQNFEPRYFNHKLLKPRLYNHENLKLLRWTFKVEDFIKKMGFKQPGLKLGLFGVEMSAATLKKLSTLWNILMTTATKLGSVLWKLTRLTLPGITEWKIFQL